MSADPFDDGHARLLSDDQCGAIQAWMRSQADRLGLRDWELVVSPFPADKDAIAQSHLRDDAEESWIAVAKDFLEMAPDRQRATLTHELLHCHFQPMKHMVDRLIADELGARAEGIFRSAVSRVEERSIDRLASGLAQLLEPFSFEATP